jgi:hypothetical protein
MPIQQGASTQSVQDFHAAVAASFVSSGAVLLNIIEALAIGPSPSSPVDVTASAIFAYGHNSLYQALRRGADALGEEVTDDYREGKSVADIKDQFDDARWRVPTG